MLVPSLCSCSEASCVSEAWHLGEFAGRFVYTLSCGLCCLPAEFTLRAAGMAAFGELTWLQCMYKHAGPFAPMNCVVEMIHVAFAHDYNQAIGI